MCRLDLAWAFNLELKRQLFGKSSALAKLAAKEITYGLDETNTMFQMDETNTKNTLHIRPESSHHWQLEKQTSIRYVHSLQALLEELGSEK